LVRISICRTLAPKWEDGGKLILRNTHVGAVQDRWSREKEGVAWPDEVRLEGFTYERLGGLEGVGTEADMLDRDVDWYLGWLKRDPGYSPQPYEQLAKVFRAAGHGAKANSVLYAGRERERDNGWSQGSYGKWLGLTLLNVTIGYGLGVRYFRVLRWVLGLTLLGALILATSPEAVEKGPFWNFFCSFDLLLPLIELSKEYGAFAQKEDLANWIKLYFYGHKIMGYLLASFLVAGLGGLTQK
jgi:hypothetical protein